VIVKKGREEGVTAYEILKNNGIIKEGEVV